MAKNKVIAGDYKGKTVNSLSMMGQTKVTILVGFTKSVEINKDTVEEYEIVDENSKTSATSAIGRGLVGSFALGPVGLLTGLSAKKKGNKTA